MADTLITEIDILDEAKDNFLTYTEEVLTDRAVPSAEDGLLSVHRKLLWTMESILKMDSKTKYKKSASLVGSTLASSYYHGDAACYGALCKIAQPYLMRYPLVDGEGNFGTQEGNGMEASSRYTNARPTIYADLMMNDFNKNVVPLKETYNGEYMEPVVLPALFPNALVNGRETIAIGLSHNSLPNNLTEVCNAIIARIEKNDTLTIDELMTHIKGPDFPLENIVVNSKDIKEAFRTGHSTVSLKVRGKYRIIGDTIIFDTIPYRVYRNKIKEQILKNADILEELIEDFSDESNVGINKLVFKVKKGVSPELVVNKLFALTSLQTTLSYNMNFIVNGTPKMCSMMTLVDAYVNHQIRVLINATKFDLDKALKRKHILEGNLIIIKDIDRAISIIKNSKDKKEAIDNLMKNFPIDLEQAEAILEIKLVRLTKLNRDDLLKELEEKQKIIDKCEKIINDETYRNKELIAIVSDLKNKYGDTRRTELLDIELPKETKKEITIIPKDVTVIIGNDNTIKRVPKLNRKTKNSTILTSIDVNTTEIIWVFCQNGKKYSIAVNDIPEGTTATKGVPIETLIEADNSKVLMAMKASDSCIYKYIIFFTKNGLIKKTNIQEYDTAKRKTGTIAIKLNEDDSVLQIYSINEEKFKILTSDGIKKEFDSTTISPTARATKGTRFIKAKDKAVITEAFIS